MVKGQLEVSQPAGRRGLAGGLRASTKRSDLRGPESGLQILVPGRINFIKIKQTSSLARPSLLSVL